MDFRKDPAKNSSRLAIAFSMSQRIKNIVRQACSSKNLSFDYQMDIRQELAAKAEKAGASSYRVTELNQGDHWHATAELYK